MFFKEGEKINLKTVLKFLREKNLSQKAKFGAKSLKKDIFHSTKMHLNFIEGYIIKIKALIGHSSNFFNQLA